MTIKFRVGHSMGFVIFTKKTMIDQIYEEVLGNDLQFNMIYVEGGSFMMGGELRGDEQPIHKVSLSSYYIGQYLITQEVWEAVMGNNPSKYIGKRRPVERVSWFETKQFIEKLKGKTGSAYRLPTEAEWEYAAKGGIKSKGFKYAGGNDIEEVAWYKENSKGGEGTSQTHEVGQKLPNELGLYDMIGNVFEWCEDWSNVNYYKNCEEQGLINNPVGPIDGEFRILRGGGYVSGALFCRPAYRGWIRPSTSRSSVGFRLVLPFQSVG